MPIETLVAPVGVDNPTRLKQIVAGLQSRSILSIDTESNGLHAYREQVCLIQISDGQTDYLIDPLAIKNMASLAPIFADPSIEKVFHACEYDIVCLKHDFGFQFANIFDTMIASRILGFNAVGLGSILESVFGLNSDKRYQQANWGVRPLSQPMLAYARLDVHYLIDLRQTLKTRLEECGRLSIALEGLNRLCQIQARSEPCSNTDRVWRVAGQQELEPHQAAVFKELLDYRETYASKHNLPVHKVLSNRHLLDIALNLPHSLEDLAENCDVSMSLIDRHGYALVGAVENGLLAEPLQRPQRLKPNGVYLDRLDALRAWRKATAQQIKVESDVILPRDLMEHIAHKNPASPDDLKQIMQDIPWRFAAYGDKILAELKTHQI